MQITNFLGLRNTVSESRQPLGALTHADNVLIDDSGAIVRRSGSTKIANGNISSSYGTRDSSMIYLVDNSDLYKFDGDSFSLLCEDFGSGVCLWTEESAGLVFARSEKRFVSIENSEKVTDLNIPVVSMTITQGAGQLPEMSAGFSAQYINAKTGMRGALSPHQIVDISKDSSLLITVPPKAGFYVSVYGFLPDSGAWSLIGDTENFLVISEYPNTHIPADDLYFDAISMPSGVDGMTFHAGRIVIATITAEKTTLIQFGIPALYHLFDNTNDSFEIPDLVTGMMSVDGKLLITGMRYIYIFSDGGLQKITNFGTPVGKPIQLMPDGSVLIWTNRGVCKFPEFQNLTENEFSVKSGFGCMTTLMEHDGSKYLVVATDDLGNAYNQSYTI